METKDINFRPSKAASGMIVGIILIFIMILIAIALHPWAIIGAGEKGVLLEWGAVQPGSYQEGWHWKIPVMQEYIKMDVKTQKIEQSSRSASKDLQDVSTTVVVNYHLQTDKVDTTYQTLRKDYESRVILPAIQESVKAVTARFNAEQLITERPTVKAQMQEILSEKLTKYNGLVLRYIPCGGLINFILVLIEIFNDLNKYLD